MAVIPTIVEEGLKYTKLNWMKLVKNKAALINDNNNELVIVGAGVF